MLVYRRHISLPACAALCLFLCLSLPAFAQENPASAAKDTDMKHPLPLEDLRLFTVIFDHIRRSYVEPVSDQELLENAVKGMLQELDPHSDYLTPSNFNTLQESTQGQFSGVGLEIGSENNYIKVISPIDGTPADKAGIQAGDLIIKLDNQSIRGFSISEAAKKMRGPKGTSILFTILRKGQANPIEITVVRDVIPTRSVNSRLLEEDYGYLRISQFQANTGRDFSAAVDKLFKKNKGIKGFVLDLRNNPGGTLQSSVDVVDALIDDGLIVYTKGRLENSNHSYSATRGDVTQGLPIVVLINGGSASAAEIVAGALQDRQRAILMGTRSFGKGSVQTVLPVGKDRGIKLTTALYFTPSGRSIQAEGIEPDVVIKRATITQLGGDSRIKESDLSGHIANATNGKNKTRKVKDKQQGTEDNQLFEALNMLKGLAIFNQARQNANTPPPAANAD